MDDCLGSDVDRRVCEALGDRCPGEWNDLICSDRVRVLGPDRSNRWPGGFETFNPSLRLDDAMKALALTGLDAAIYKHAGDPQWQVDLSLPDGCLDCVGIGDTLPIAVCDAILSWHREPHLPDWPK